MPAHRTIDQANGLIMSAKILFFDNINVNDKQFGKRYLHFTGSNLED